MSRSESGAASIPDALRHVPNRPNVGYGRSHLWEGKVATEPPPSSPAASSRPSADLDVSTFARHRLWLARPTARISLDLGQDRLLASFYPVPPDREIDPSPDLSTGFHGPDSDLLMTSLCLFGVARWSHEPIPDDVWTARQLLGGTVGGTVEELLSVDLAATSTEVVSELCLDPDEAGALAQTWREFVRRHEAGHHPADA